MKVMADAVMEGDFIPGLDNGYVVTAEEGDVQIALPGDNEYGLLESVVTITYHDAEGDECYLILNPGSLVTVERN